MHIEGITLIDPRLPSIQVVDLVIEQGRFVEVGKADRREGECRFSGEGWWAVPGLFDMHTHLREPGFEHKETIESGLRAAAAGGFTGVACMPNTEPPVDNPSVVRFIRERGEGFPVKVYPIGAITRGRKGEQLSDMGELVRMGVTAFSDDGSPVASAEMMRRAMEYAQSLGALIIEHCEVPELCQGGVAHESEVATRLGLSGMPSVGESIAIYRNLALAQYTGVNLHIAHLSTKEGLHLVSRFKQAGVPVTCEVTPHHLMLTCDLLVTYDTNLKVNPPLREREDRDALVDGLRTGIIDAIATDHAPHSPEEKEVEFSAAPFGIIGLETALGIVLTHFVHQGLLTPQQLVEIMSLKPKSLLKLPTPKIEVGEIADITLIDPECQWTVDPSLFYSRSRNTPYAGWRLKGKAVGVINGDLAWVEER